MTVRVRPPRFSDLPRVTSRLRNWRRGTKGFREERHNLFIHSPIVLPLPYSPVFWMSVSHSEGEELSPVGGKLCFSV